MLGRNSAGCTMVPCQPCYFVSSAHTLFTLRSPFDAHYSFNREDPCCAKALPPVALQDEKLATSTHPTQGGKTTKAHLTASSFVPEPQGMCVALSYTHSTTLALDVFHILSPHHLAPCYMKEWYLAWHGDTAYAERKDGK